jgi:hypothetical protein
MEGVQSSEICSLIGSYVCETKTYRCFVNIKDVRIIEKIVDRNEDLCENNTDEKHHNELIFRFPNTDKPSDSF